MSHDTRESAMARSSRNYARLKAQHRCVQCAEKLPDDSKFVRCLECRERQHGDGSARRHLERIAKFQADLAKVIATSGTMTVQQQAANLGIDVDRVYALRNRARKNGATFQREKGGAPKGNDYNHESLRWRELEAFGACPRCSLRGPHECLTSIYELASGRRGGPTYPQGGY